MNTQQRLKRVARLEQVINPQPDGGCTLEELCRSMWQENKKSFIELAKNNSYQSFVYQFQQEDADIESHERRRIVFGGRAQGLS